MLDARLADVHVPRYTSGVGGRETRGHKASTAAEGESSRAQDASAQKRTGVEAIEGAVCEPSETDAASPVRSAVPPERMEDWSADSLLGAMGLEGGVCAPGEEPSEPPSTSAAPRLNKGSPPRIDEPAPGESRPGFIDNDDGANLRNRPAELPGSETLTGASLPPATRVFVSGRHPQTADWWYVTAFLPNAIVRGYVQGLRVTTDLPEPSAKLHQVRPGDTAEQLAVREFASAVRDGHDLRYYENVLLFVNRQHHRAGVRGAYQDPGAFGGGSNNVQLEAGRRIWLVSPAYARALEAVVPDGSLTNGAVAKAKRFVGHIEDILKSVTTSPHHLGEVAGEYAQAIRDHMVEIVGVIAGFVMVEAASSLLAVSPTGAGQIAAVVIQLGLAAFGAAGMVTAGAQALEHAVQWLTLAWTASGKEEKIAAASRELVRMLVCLAMAALSFTGAKGNFGKAASIANSMPTMLPALAVAGGGQMGGGGVGTAAALGPPRPFGPLATGMAMSSEEEAHGTGAKEKSGEPASDAPEPAEPATQTSETTASTTSAQAGVATRGGAARAALYAQNWAKASLQQAIDKFAPGSSGVAQGQKLVFTNQTTGLQVVYDPAGKYFRIENPSLAHRRYLDMSGQVPNNKIVNGKQMGRSQAEYNQATHFSNTD